MAEDTRWIGGINPVETALAAGAGHVRRVLVGRRRRDGRTQRVLDRARAAGVPVERTEDAVLDEYVTDGRHQGICAEVAGRGALDEHQLLELVERLERPPFLLALDRVQDPHNLGACLRSAAAAGCDAVIVPRDHSARLTPVVERAAAGATALVPLAAVTNLARVLERLQESGCWVIGTSGDAGESLYQADLTGGLVIVAGGEGGGMRAKTRRLCDHLVGIPLAGPIESLNVSVAVGICLFEAVRQRGVVGEETGNHR